MTTSNDALTSLLEAAQPDLYRVNGFRVLGVPVGASERSIKRRAEQAQLLEKFGGGASRAGVPLPLNPAPGLDAIRQAVHRLNNPGRRLFDELFWFWPEREEGVPDRALEALIAGDVKAATEAWYGRIELDGHGVATHNIAVLYHASALDLEFIPEVSPLSTGLRKLQTAYWVEAFARWRALIADVRFWRLMETRIKDLNDPSLPSRVASDLRGALPLALLLVNARLAAAAAERGEAAEVERQKRLMRQSGLKAEAAENALRRAAQQAVSRVRALCAASEAEAEAEPPRADIVVRRLLEQSELLVAQVEALLPENDPMPAELRDEVAGGAINSLVPYGQQPGTWRTALELLEKSRPLARSSGVRDRLDDLRAHLLRSAYLPEPAAGANGATTGASSHKGAPRGRGHGT